MMTSQFKLCIIFGTIPMEPISRYM